MRRVRPRRRCRLGNFRYLEVRHIALGDGRNDPWRNKRKLREQPDVMILDVREQDEWNAGHIPGAVFMPMGEVPNRLSEIPTDKTVIVQCRSGNRSSQVTDFLVKQGFTNVHNMSGGINAWQSAGLPVEQ